MFNKQILKIKNKISGFYNKKRLKKHLCNQDIINCDIFNHIILNSVFAEVVVLNSQGVITMVNEPWKKFNLENRILKSKTTPSTYIGVNYLSICKAAEGSKDEQIATEISQGIQSVINGSIPVFSTEYSCDSEVEKRWFSISVTPLGHVGNGVVVSHENITNRKLIEIALKESNFRFKLFMDALPAMAYIRNIPGNLIFINKYIENKFGIENWKDKLVKDIYTPILEKIIGNDEDIDTNDSIFKEDNIDVSGSIKTYKTFKFKIPQIDTQSLIGGISFDITEFKNIQKSLSISVKEAQEAKVIAENANLSKSRFFAAASHDLRQPLFALSLYVNMINNPKADQDKLKMHINKSVNGLTLLLNDLLDVNKLDSGLVKVKLTDFRLSEVLSELIDMYSVQAISKSIDFRYRKTDLIIRSDKILFQRMLGNIINNAIKFTNNGDILISCRIKDGKKWLEIWDTGIGFIIDKSDLIFEEFVQLGDSSRNSGSGLGLSIVKRIAKLLDINIRVNSKIGHGSMFAIELIEGKCSPEIISKIESLHNELYTIGLIEDNSDVRNALVMMLECAGHKIYSDESSKLFLSQLNDVKLDILICDYRLKDGLNGFDAILDARKIYGDNFPCIIITGDTDPVLMRCMNKNNIKILYKPIQINLLLDTIKQVVEKQ